MLNGLHKLEHELRTALAVARKNCTNELLAARYCATRHLPRELGKGGLYVRTLHGERTTRHFLCAL